MSQYSFGNLSSPLSGQVLIDTHLEPWRDALHTSHSGTSRPAYAVAGFVWLDTTTTPWVVKMYDGADDITIGTVNASTNIFNPAGYAILDEDNMVSNSATAIPTQQSTRQYVTDSVAAAAPRASMVVAAGGTVNAITATYSPVVTLTNGIVVGIISAGANTSATPTFSPDSLTARTIVKQGGISLQNGDIGPAGSVHYLSYNLANTRWELLNPVGDVSGSWTPSPTGLTVVGTPTYTGFWRRVGRTIFWTLQVDSTTSTSSTAGTSYFSGLPINAAANGTCTAVNSGSYASLGVGKVNSGTDRVYLPSWTTLSNVNLSGFYFI